MEEVRALQLSWSSALVDRDYARGLLLRSQLALAREMDRSYWRGSACRNNHREIEMAKRGEESSSQKSGFAGYRHSGVFEHDTEEYYPVAVLFEVGEEGREHDTLITEMTERLVALRLAIETSLSKVSIKSKCGTSTEPFHHDE